MPKCAFGCPHEKSALPEGARDSGCNSVERRETPVLGGEIQGWNQNHVIRTQRVMEKDFSG
jgi:hypothetical protein